MREKFLAFLSVIMGLTFAWLSSLAMYAVLIAWIVLSVLGTVIFVVFGGHHRCFYTALFSTMFTIGMAVIFAVGGAFKTLGDNFTIIVIDLLFVVLPTILAWLVTRILRYNKPSA
jgi:hypothetical protein